MKWLNVEDIRFENHGCIFTIPRWQTEWMEATNLVKGLRENQHDVESLSKVLYGIVVKSRPELVGCSIILIGYSLPWRCWEVMVMHPSLPLVPFNCEFPKEQLIKNAHVGVAIGTPSNPSLASRGIIKSEPVEGDAPGNYVNQ